VKQAVREIKAGKVEFRTDKTALVHTPIGKISFPPERLWITPMPSFPAVMKAKPVAAKGKYVKSITLSSTMGPGVPIGLDVAEAHA